MSIIFIALAGGALLASPWHIFKSLPALFLLFTAAATLVIFGSPGIAYNHLIDLQVAAIVFFAIWAARHRASFPLGGCVLAIAAVLCCAHVVVKFNYRDNQPLRAQLRELLAMAGDSEEPILTENSILPALNNERSYMLDVFSFRVLARKNPAFARHLQHRLEERYFRAVILFTNLDTEAGRAYFKRRQHFGPGFAEKLLENYEFVGEKHDYFVYLPRKSN